MNCECRERKNLDSNTSTGMGGEEGEAAVEGWPSVAGEEDGGVLLDVSAVAEEEGESTCDMAVHGDAQQAERCGGQEIGVDWASVPGVAALRQEDRVRCRAERTGDDDM